MPDFIVTTDVIRRIADLTTAHFRDINEEVSEAYPETPDATYALALGFALSTLLKALSDGQARANAVNGINLLVRLTGYALAPVT